MLPTRLTAIAAACLLTVACGGGGGDTPPPSGGGNDGAGEVSVADEVLVRLRSAADLDGVLATHGLVRLGAFGSRPIYRLGAPAGTDLETLVDTLRVDTRVLRASENRLTDTPEGRRRTVWAIGEAQAYTTQWAPQALRLAEAQAIHDGSGVRVAVLDTGVDLSHPALAGRLLPGRDFVDDDDDPSEVAADGSASYGHGTHVAGLVALAAPGAMLMPLRVLDAQGRGNVWVLGEALLHAVDPDGDPLTDDGAHVINLSLGTTEETEVLEDLIDRISCDDDEEPGEEDDDDDDDDIRCAAGGGAVVVAAAGNDGSPTLLQYPAAEQEPGLLAIGASAENRRLAGFSNSGSWIHLTTPGEGITSSVPGGGYGTWSGTSMSAPFAAGIAALLRGAQPALPPQEVAARMVARAAALCDGQLPALDAAATLQDAAPPAPTCP